MLYFIAICIIAFLTQRTFFYKNLSEKDTFTGCYNKDWAIQRKNSKLVRMMRRSRRTKGKFGILFIDMDNFKQVNDTKGHLVGDGIIKATVAAITHCLSEKDVAVRFGGDEFMVIQDFTCEDSLYVLAESIRDNVEHSTARTVSIGGAIFKPDMDIKVEDLVNAADANVYLSKERGKNCATIPMSEYYVQDNN